MYILMKPDYQTLGSKNLIDMIFSYITCIEVIIGLSMYRDLMNKSKLKEQKKTLTFSISKRNITTICLIII